MRTRANLPPGRLPARSEFDIKRPRREPLAQIIELATTVKILLVISIALLAIRSGQTQAASIVTTVRMEADPDHKMVGVLCRVNGTEHSYICVIDSGATNTIISDRVLTGEGPTIDMTTGNGVVRVRQRVVSLTIAGGLRLKSKAYVQSAMPEGVDILVGQDVLRQFQFVIFDYENRQVEFQR
jgi:hypothetical protein